MDPTERRLPVAEDAKVAGEALSNRFQRFWLMGRDRESVIGQFHARGKGGIDIGMLTQLMAEMGEPGAGNVQLPYFVDGFCKCKMGDMFLVAECVEDDHLAAPDLRAFGLINAIRIGDVREISEAETQYGHFEMPDLDRDNRDIADGKGFFVDVYEPEIGDAGIFHISESIRKFSYYRLLGHFICVKIHRLVLEKIVCPNVVQPRQMVLMRMRKDHGVEFSDLLPQHLVAKISGGIDDDSSCC